MAKGTAFRVGEPSDPVTITLDGQPIRASRGEPICASLIAAGDLALARSPKFHRPRGPSCMRAACDGCLMRVDGVPNVMTCMTPAEEGTEVVSQNALGSREIDLLRVTDWFFPDGMNHHELFAGVPGVQSVMQAFARRVAGLGKLPAEVVLPRTAQRRELDVVVVGAGPSGMAVACRLAELGRRVVVLDDAPSPGGGLRALGEEAEPFRAIAAPFSEHLHARRIVLVAGTTAAGFYGDDLLVVGPTGARVVRAGAVILATGAHDGVVPFEGNDLPGVMSARAAGLLLGRGVCVGSRVVVVVAPNGGPFGEAFAREAKRLAPGVEVTIVRGAPVRVRGGLAPRSVEIAQGKTTKTYRADAVLVDAPRAPSYELAEQAGARIVHRPAGFLALTDGEGRLRDHVWGVGELVGTAFEPEAMMSEARRVARAIVDDFVRPPVSAPSSEA